MHVARIDPVPLCTSPTLEHHTMSHSICCKFAADRVVLSHSTEHLTRRRVAWATGRRFLWVCRKKNSHSRS